MSMLTELFDSPLDSRQFGLNDRFDILTYLSLNPSRTSSYSVIETSFQQITNKWVQHRA